MYGLLPRERCVARHMLHGWDFPTIASQLGISVVSVRVHAKRCYEKTGQDNAIGFVLFVLSRLDALHEVFDVR